jgi:hypothetical protein
MVELAREFGQSAVVQSICNCTPVGDPACQADFGEAMDAIIEVVVAQLGGVCLPQPLVRQEDGMVHCDVTWELPRPSEAVQGAPTACSALAFLEDHGVAESGGALCKVTQLAVDGHSVDSGDGWYYDDTPDAQAECKPKTPQRVAFTANAKPPTGVRVALECGSSICE